jgi:hypothetical protein
VTKNDKILNRPPKILYRNTQRTFSTKKWNWVDSVGWSFSYLIFNQKLNASCSFKGSIQWVNVTIPILPMLRRQKILSIFLLKLLNY